MTSEDLGDRRRRPPRSLAAAVAAACSAAVLLLTVVAISAPDNPVDEAVLETFTSIEQPWTPGVAASVRHLGVTVPATATLLLSILLWVSRRRREALVLSGGYLAAMTASVLIKMLIDRPRPATTDLPGAVEGASFPSISVVSCTVFWGLVLMYAAHSAPPTIRCRDAAKTAHDTGLDPRHQPPAGQSQPDVSDPRSVLYLYRVECSNHSRKFGSH